MRHSYRIFCVALLWVLAASAGRAQTSTTAPAKKPATPAKAPAAGLGTFETALLHPATLKEKAPAEYDVKFETTAGDFTIHVTRAWAPIGADRFYNLVRHHFYDGASFFRVISGFMAQFGISAYPQVTAAWEQANIKDDPVVQSNHRGYVTYGTAGPNTRTTQVFINFGNNERLDQDGFAAFGRITDGMDVVDKLYSGYGEGAPEGRGPDQGRISKLGHAYLDQNFPKLDKIKTATILTPDTK